MFCSKEEELKSYFFQQLECLSQYEQYAQQLPWDSLTKERTSLILSFKDDLNFLLAQLV